MHMILLLEEYNLYNSYFFYLSLSYIDKDTGEIKKLKTTDALNLKQLNKVLSLFLDYKIYNSDGIEIERIFDE